ncbi:MAG: acyl--CoA ligase [Paludibacter sp.]|nr:acyl--CoA ligase [Paludibacter sp.]
MSIFFKDKSRNQLVSWEKLIEDLREIRSFNRYCKSDDYYEIFKNIIISMLSGNEIILLDSDISQTELSALLGSTSLDNTFIPVDKKITQITDKINLIEKLSHTNKLWRVSLFTSGTTGVPKQVNHNYETLTRFVKLSDKHQSDIWGYAFNPTHMAGLQVFLQALLNGNAIIRLFGLSMPEIHQEIELNQISNISATPTFYRLLFPCEQKFLSVNRLTSGGEKFNVVVSQRLKEIFPCAKLTNVYASTEAGTLFASVDDIFTVKTGFENLVKEINGELLIHKSLMANSISPVDDWYKTGDLIEIINPEPLKFRFILRKNEMINVGGYKVNPQEVEEVLQSFSGIEAVKVYSKSNSVLGNIVCCDIVSSFKLQESAIRLYLQTKLQEFKIPRIIRFVENLETTRTGKLKRN